jgi:enamine deaminase RidA (YjgF/YER057c/UK114 family)
MPSQSITVERGDVSDVFVSSTPTLSLNLDGQVREMFDSLGDNLERLHCARVFVSDAGYIETVKRVTDELYGAGEGPVVSHIIAPPTNGTKVSMVGLGVDPRGSGEVTSEVIGDEFGNRGRIITYDGTEQIFLGDIVGDLNQGFVPQMQGALENANKLIEKYGFNFLRDMVRTWFSITDISELREDNRTNYLDFNELARTPFLKRLGFKGQFFASTGIGDGEYLDGRFGEFSLVAYKNDQGQVKFVPMDNPLQTPVYRYNDGDEIDPEKKMVCFERGYMVITPTVVLYFISGTASIRANKETGGPVKDQTITTIENIGALLEAYDGRLSDIVSAVTYVRPEEDPAIVERVYSDKGMGPSDIAHLIVTNTICYRPLNMETEAIAVVPRAEYDRRVAMRKK